MSEVFEDSLVEVIRWPDHEVVWVAPDDDLDRVFPMDEARWEALVAAREKRSLAGGLGDGG